MKSEEKLLASIFKKVLSTNLNFVAWQLPNSNNIQLIVSQEKDTFKYKSFDSIQLEDNIYMFAPFQISKQNPIYVLRPTLSFQLNAINNQIVDEIEDLEKKEKSLRFEDINPIDFSVYQKSFTQLFNLKNWEKVVLSSYKLLDWKADMLCKPFLSICANSFNTYNYLLKIEDEIWIGASPEKLLTSNNNTASTIALAATQKIEIHKNLEDYKWNEKEYNEHNIVVDYIYNKLHHLNFEKQKTKTIFAGQLAHLQTEFIQNIEDKKDFNLISFLEQMHPTPAVAGLPKETSIQIINSIEKYNRSYYTGFLGMIEKGKTDIFVNLRCAKQYAYKLCLFAGGGIVPKSNLEMEWQEIKIKTDNLKRYFN